MGCRKGVFPFSKNDNGRFEHIDIFATPEAGAIYECKNSEEVEQYLTQDESRGNIWMPTDEFKDFLNDEFCWFEEIIELAYKVLSESDRVKEFFEMGEDGDRNWQLPKHELEGALIAMAKAVNIDVKQEDYPEFSIWKMNQAHANRFTDHEWAHMHDCILHCTWETTKKKCTREELEKVFKTIPESLKGEAREFGMNDTLWRDKFIEWFEKQEIWKF